MQSKQEKIDWDKMIAEAKTLPDGKELPSIWRYKVLCMCIEKLEKVHFWQFKERKFYKTVINRAL